jgi:hypothetical protein
MNGCSSSAANLSWPPQLAALVFTAAELARWAYPRLSEEPLHKHRLAIARAAQPAQASPGDRASSRSRQIAE